MEKQSRRKFVASAVALGTSAVATGMPTMESKDKKQLVHHVFFWLKNPDSKEDLAKLLAGLQTLRKIETIRKINIGVPASTEKRDVVDNSYAASELMYFDDLAGKRRIKIIPSIRSLSLIALIFGRRLSSTIQ
jgi:hypothetical protein